MAGFIIAGTHSGAGKTTASFAVMAHLTERAFNVQPFKIGPDFIDPGYHRLATGRTSINLDLWMMGLRGIKASLKRHSAISDAAVVEGMGALHDGEKGGIRGSAAHLARLLDLPVLLVLDIWGVTRSAAAMIQGYEAFDPRIRIAGFILNRAGSRRHFEMIRDGLPPSLRKRLLGYLPADDALHVAERHLGLLTLEENPRAGTLREEVLSKTRETLDMDRLIEVFGVKRRPRAGVRPARPRPLPRVRIGIAQDSAFCFYYLENLHLLTAAGAELVPFSPVLDRTLPKGLAGLYLGGGYPESFATELATNRKMKRQIRDFAHQGGAIYAECGGLMYLGRALTDFDGQAHAMASLLPLEVAMDRRYLAIRYVEIETTRPSLLGPAGTLARGHEFHHSRIVRTAPPEVTGCYRVSDVTGAVSFEGFSTGSVLGSYIHLHFGSNRRIPESFVRVCALGGAYCQSDPGHCSDGPN